MLFQFVKVCCLQKPIFTKLGTEAFDIFPPVCQIVFYQ